MKLRSYDVKESDAILFVGAIMNTPQELLASAINFITEAFDPEEIYDELQLQQWATNNGWVVEEDQ